MKFFLLLFLFVPVFSYSKVTVSGISSGAYMAQQFHTAFSQEVSGVGIVAGGPYYCAKGQIVDALNRCMKTTLGIPSAKDSLKAAEKFAREGEIDPVENLKSAKVFAISGTNDETVLQKVSDVMVETYKLWGVTPSNLHYENKLPVGHAFPTENFGNRCETKSESPYLSNCGRDVAGEILNHLLGPLAPRVSPKASRLFSFDQLIGDGIDFDRLSMGKVGYAYIPEGCERPDLAGCSVHIAFHGCKQTLDDIQTTFITKAGYNSWAEANRIVILYPQAERNILVNNPNGCWDWWGYSGPEYHTKNGPQMKVVARMLEALTRGELQLNQTLRD